MWATDEGVLRYTPSCGTILAHAFTCYGIPNSSRGNERQERPRTELNRRLPTSKAGALSKLSYVGCPFCVIASCLSAVDAHAPGWIRTSDRAVISGVLHQTELRALLGEVLRFARGWRGTTVPRRGDRLDFPSQFARSVSPPPRI